MGTVPDYRAGLMNDHPFEEATRIDLAACQFQGPDGRTARSEDLPKPSDRHAEPFGSSAYSDEESSNPDSDASSIRSYSTSNTSYSGESIFAEPSDCQEAQDRHSWNLAAPVISGLSKPLDERSGAAAAAAAAEPVRSHGRIDCPSSNDASSLVEAIKSSAALAKVCSTQPTASEGCQQAQPGNKPVPSTRCRRRSVGTACAPPRLRRDTDSADLFVNLLIAFACRLITAIWPLAATPPMMSDCFNGAGVLPLHTFIFETLRRSKTSYSTLQIALYYLILLKANLPRPGLTKEKSGSSASSQAPGAQSCRAMQCGRRMFLAALILASKYIQDRNYSTRAWSKISGLRIPEINENERQYLRLVNYSLHIKQGTFENWSKVVLLLSRISKMQPRSFDQGQRPASLPLNAHLLPTLSGQHSRSTSPALYTKDWWNNLCSSLDPSMFQDSAKTDAFIIQHIPVEQIESDMHMAPTPTNAGQAGSDLTFSEPSGSRNSSSTVSTPLQLAASSPAYSSDIPTRPQPRKLQTPSSTPGGPEFSCAVSQFGTPTLRHATSVDALRGLCMRKQACNASIDRCPPPQTPQATSAAPDTRISSLPGPSPPMRLSRQPSRVFLPPVALSQYRSRSNSVSSNSSSSTVMSPPRDPSASCANRGLLVAPKPIEGGSRSIPESGVPGQHRPLRRKRASGNLVPGAKPDRDQDEGYHSAEDPRRYSIGSEQGQVDLENSVAGALVAMSVGGQDSITPKALPLRSQNSTPKASAAQSSWSCGLKRTSSKASESLRFFCGDSYAKDTMLQPSPPTASTINNMSHSAKQVQHPHRAWAQLKQPVWNTHPCKRIAMDGSLQPPQVTAPELGSSWLRPDIEAQ